MKAQLTLNNKTYEVEITEAHKKIDGIIGGEK